MEASRRREIFLARFLGTVPQHFKAPKQEYQLYLKCFKALSVAFLDLKSGKDHAEHVLKPFTRDLYFKRIGIIA
jgi:hypothetical protein